MSGFGQSPISVAPRRGAPSIFTLGATTEAPVVRPATPVAAVAPVAGPSAPIASVEASNPFTALLGDQQNATAQSQAAAAPTLLAPFAGGAGLLAAFVVAEALGLPLALRER